MGETNNFPGLKNETETETFNFGLMEPRPRPRLSFWVSWNRDRDRDFNMKSRETETFTRPDILSLGGTETGTETTKVSVPRVSAPRPPISGTPPLKNHLFAKRFFPWIFSLTHLSNEPKWLVRLADFKNSWYLEQSVVSLISKYIRVAESYYCNCCGQASSGNTQNTVFRAPVTERLKSTFDRCNRPHSSP